MPPSCRACSRRRNDCGTRKAVPDSGAARATWRLMNCQHDKTFTAGVGGRLVSRFRAWHRAAGYFCGRSGSGWGASVGTAGGGAHAVPFPDSRVSDGSAPHAGARGGSPADGGAARNGGHRHPGIRGGGQASVVGARSVGCGRKAGTPSAGGLGRRSARRSSKSRGAVGPLCEPGVVAGGLAYSAAHKLISRLERAAATDGALQEMQRKLVTISNVEP
mgnify:CR=1 FL=1